MRDMMGRLRLKFVLINMLLVTLVLLIVFGALLLSTKNRLEDNSYETLRHAVDRAMNDPPAKFPIAGPGGMRKEQPLSGLPVFTVQMHEDGSLEVFSDNAEVSVEVAEQAVQLVQQTGKERGVLAELGLRYLVRHTPVGTKIGFADLSSERSTLRSQSVNALLIGCCGLLAFLGISIFLANWALRPVARAWQQQQQFVADASHELKTPLTVILANMGILLSHPETSVAAQKKWIEHTRDEAARMKALVEDLLFLARSDASPKITMCTQFDLSDAAWACLLPLEPLAFERGIDLQSEVAPALQMTGDEGQIKQLIVILLDNACKYAGEHGTVRFSLEEAQDKAVLRVHNTGIPIAQQDIAHLFERFYRADKSRARSEDRGGYGLGLAIADRIVHAHHGKISVSSSQEKGTVFTVSLPLDKP